LNKNGSSGSGLAFQPLRAVQNGRLKMKKKNKSKPENIIICGLSPEEKKKDMSITLPRLLVDAEMIMTAKTIEDAIVLINNTRVLGFWLKHPGEVADLFLGIIRMILIHLRSKSNKDFPTIPSAQEGWLGLKDWFTDVRQTKIEYTKPMTMKKWAEILEVPENSMKALRKSGKYHFDEVNGKWRLPKNEVPVEWLEQFRNKLAK
jgi:hypothetical protein